MSCLGLTKEKFLEVALNQAFAKDITLTGYLPANIYSKK